MDNPTMRTFHVRYHIMIKSPAPDNIAELAHSMEIPTEGLCAKVRYDGDMSVEAVNVYGARQAAYEGLWMRAGKESHRQGVTVRLDNDLADLASLGTDRTAVIQFGIDAVYNEGHYTTIHSRLVSYVTHDLASSMDHKQQEISMISSLVAEVVSSDEEARIAGDIVAAKLQVSNWTREITYGEAFPGVYDHHGFPTAYDICREEPCSALSTGDALNLVRDKGQLRRLIEAAMPK